MSSPRIQSGGAPATLGSAYSSGFLTFTAYSIHKDLTAADTPVTSYLPFLLLGVALLIALGFEFVNDVVIVPAVDRLSRDTTDLLVIARELQKAGAGLRSLAEPVVNTTSDFAELVLAMLGVAAKLERRRIKERTARGRADAKANGVKFGRKPKLTPHQKREAIKRRDQEGETLRSIGRSYNVSAATISRLIVSSNF